MNRNRVRKRALGTTIGLSAIVAVGVTLGVGYVVVGFKLQGGMGSLTEARKLRPKVEAMPVPSTTRVSAETMAIVFPNGEWIVGVAKDSHAQFAQINGGGTVVLKDSRGRVRSFFGHVCGGGNLMFHPPASLDAFDSDIRKGFVEVPWLNPDSQD